MCDQVPRSRPSSRNSDAFFDNQQKHKHEQMQQATAGDMIHSLWELVETDPRFLSLNETFSAFVAMALQWTRNNATNRVVYVGKYAQEAVAIANDTPYGLAAYLQTGNPERARRVAAKLRTGSVHINGGGINYGTPFGGYKQSGNGREGGMMGLEDYLETKTLHGLT